MLLIISKSSIGGVLELSNRISHAIRAHYSVQKSTMHRDYPLSDLSATNNHSDKVLLSVIRSGSANWLQIKRGINLNIRSRKALRAQRNSRVRIRSLY